MVYCSVPYCKSNTNTSKGCGISFHRFPKDEELKTKWCLAISRQGNRLGSLWKPTVHSTVCSRHFKDSDYSVSTTLKILLPNVIPSVFEDFPVHKQPQSHTRRPHKRKATEVGNEGKPYKKIELHVEPTTSIASEENDPPPVIISEPLYKTTGTQCSIGLKLHSTKIGLKLKRTVRKCRKQRALIVKQKNVITTLKERIHQLKTEKNKHGLDNELNKMTDLAEQGDLKANFLIEQIQAFSKQKCKFRENTIKVCILLSNRSSTGYRLLRALNILHLPHQKTLKTYLGHSRGETGITSLVRARLIAEKKSLQHDNEKVGSLIIDEMAIKSKLVYDRNLDMLLGMTDVERDSIGIEDKLANKLLCILFKGLSTHYRIPVSYYFTHSLTGDQLTKLTCEALQVVEDCGFQVVRIVTDNCQVNVAMFHSLCGKEADLAPQIQHPLDPSRPIFLSFDPSHILKNVRSQHLSRNFKVNGNVVTADYVKKLYHLQKRLVVKPVRKLTRKVVYPTNLEKMNVARAKVIFSTETIAGLKSLEKVSPEEIGDRNSFNETIYFLEMFQIWHDIHDICNTTHATTSRNSNKFIFSSLDDDRLSWLTNEFISYVEAIQTNADKSNRFTRETFQALVLTTLSTAACIKYLLSINFHYVLTRNFTSDDIELFFSHLRQKGGFNDMLDTRSCLYAMEATLQTGIIAASNHGSVELRNGSKSDLPPLITKKKRSEVQVSGGIEIPDIPPHVLHILEKPIQESVVTLSSVSLAMIAGYLIHVAEEETSCDSCLQKISLPATDSPAVGLCLIRFQDRGGLRYPNAFFRALIQICYDFVIEAVHYLPRKHYLPICTHYLKDRFLKELMCKICNNKTLPLLLLQKLLKPLLDNIARKISSKCEYIANLDRKPLNRKVLKLS